MASPRQIYVLGTGPDTGRAYSWVVYCPRPSSTAVGGPPGLAHSLFSLTHTPRHPYTSPYKYEFGPIGALYTQSDTASSPNRTAVTVQGPLYGKPRRGYRQGHSHRAHARVTRLAVSVMAGAIRSVSRGLALAPRGPRPRCPRAWVAMPCRSRLKR